MRPALLNPLFAPVTSLAGVGPKQDKLFRYLLGRDETPRLVDLLLHLPASVIDRRARPKIRDAVPGTVVTLEVTVDRHRPPPPRNARAPYLVYASDDTGDVVLTYLPRPAGLCRKTAAGRRQALRLRHRCRCMTASRRSCIPTASSTKRVLQNCRASIPVYPLTEGLALGSLRRAMAQALQKLPALAGMDQPGSDPPLQVSADRRSAEPRPCAGRADRHPARWPVLVAACLRRTAGRSTGAGAGARAVAPPGRRPPRRRRPSAQQDHRRAALCADGVAARGGRPPSPRICASRCGCCGCCRATSDPARPWWRCWRPPPSPKSASRPR